MKYNFNSKNAEQHGQGCGWNNEACQFDQRQTRWADPPIADDPRRWSDNSLICSSTPRGFFVKIKKVNFGKQVRLSPLDGNKRKTIDIGPFSPF